jgi:hypothetical protein
MDCTGRFLVGDMAVLMALFFGHLGGEEQATTALVVVALRQWHLLDHVLEARSRWVEGGPIAGVCEGFSR